MSQVDLRRLADRISAAADRAGDLTITASGTDLILSKDGYGAGRSESAPFAALFLREDDVLAQALDRLLGAPASQAGGPASTLNISNPTTA